MMRRWLVGTGAAVLAAVACSAAIGQSLALLQPGLAGLALVGGGTSKAAAASALFGAEKAAHGPTNEPIYPGSAAVALARQAYREEPLAARSHDVLALDIARRDPAKSVKVLEASFALTRRNTDVEISLIAAYSKLGEDPQGLRVIDAMLRRETRIHGQLLTTLATGTGQARLLPDIRRLLENNPPWAVQYWRQLAQNPAGLENAARLRTGFGRPTNAAMAAVDQLLVQALADRRRFADASAIAALIGIKPSDGPEKVRDPRFQHKPSVPVFEWELARTGDYEANVIPDASMLMITALPASRGRVARQLVKLPSAGLTLRVEPGSVTNGSPGDVRIALDCAEDGRSLWAGPLGAITASVAMRGCRWAWLEVNLETSSDGPGLDASIKAISLTGR